MPMLRIRIPFHLRTLAGVSGNEVQVDLPEKTPVTIRAVIDAIEAKYPMLTGTIRDHGSDKRRPMLRFFLLEEDWSNESMDKALPEKVARGEEPLFIIGAIAGG